MSGPAQRTALEVLAANDVVTIIQKDDGFTPTPVISRAILVHNRNRKEHFADGIVTTPSHNPPVDGGFKVTEPTERRPRRHRRNPMGERRAMIGGLKVVTGKGWFAARPSGTRTSTRSMRRALRIKIIWSRSWRKRKKL